MISAGASLVTAVLFFDRYPSKEMALPPTLITSAPPGSFLFLDILANLGGVRDSYKLRLENPKDLVLLCTSYEVHRYLPGAGEAFGIAAL